MPGGECRQGHLGVLARWVEGRLARLPQSSTLPPSPSRLGRPDDRKRAAPRRVWSEALPITAADPVDTYLRQRGIALPLADFSTVLRSHPHLVYRHEDGQRTSHPAMVARVDDANGQGVSLHRIYLASDGHRADVPTVKKLMSPAVPGATRGGAIRLYSADETLAVTEGIETALAVRLAIGLPVWAMWKPTMLIDEADTFLCDNDELRGVLNTGHTRATAYVIRTVGEDHEP